MFAQSKESSKLYNEYLNRDSESTLEKSSFVTRDSIPIFSKIKNVKDDKEKKEKLNQLLDALRKALPVGFKIGAAVGEGDCFFDSVAQGLNELKGKGLITSDEGFNVKSLRRGCKEYAQKESSAPQSSWLNKLLDKESEKLYEYIPRIEFTVEDIKNSRSDSAVGILNLQNAIWGRPYIEGKILCNKYKVNLCYMEVQDDLIIENGKFYLRLEEDGKTKRGEEVSDVILENVIKVDSENTEQKAIHILNYKQHFVPLLSDLKEDIEEAIKVSRKEIYGILDNKNSHSLTEDTGNHDLEEQKPQVQVQLNQDSFTATDVYGRLKEVKFDRDDSGNPGVWAGMDQINSYINNQAIKTSANVGELAYYIGSNNFGFDSKEGIEDIAKHICRKEGISNSFYGDKKSLDKPFIVISNTATVLAQSSTDVNQQGGAHWISWVLLPKKYVSLSGKEIDNDKYQVFFFDSLSEISFPEGLKKFLIEGDEITEITDTGEKCIRLLPFCTKEEIDFCDLKELTVQQRGVNGSDCGWWAVYYALMAVYTGGVEFLDPLKEKKLSPVPLRNIMNLQEASIIQQQSLQNFGNIDDIDKGYSSFFSKLPSGTTMKALYIQTGSIDNDRAGGILTFCNSDSVNFTDQEIREELRKYKFDRLSIDVQKEGDTFKIKRLKLKRIPTGKEDNHVIPVSNFLQCLKDFFTNSKDFFSAVEDSFFIFSRVKQNERYYRYIKDCYGNLEGKKDKKTLEEEELIVFLEYKLVPCIFLLWNQRDTSIYSQTRTQSELGKEGVAIKLINGEFQKLLDTTSSNLNTLDKFQKGIEEIRNRFFAVLDIPTIVKIAPHELKESSNDIKKYLQTRINAMLDYPNNAVIRCFVNEIKSLIYDDKAVSVVDDLLKSIKVSGKNKKDRLKKYEEIEKCCEDPQVKQYVQCLQITEEIQCELDTLKKNIIGYNKDNDLPKNLKKIIGFCGEEKTRRDLEMLKSGLTDILVAKESISGKTQDTEVSGDVNKLKYHIAILRVLQYFGNKKVGDIDPQTTRAIDIIAKKDLENILYDVRKLFQSWVYILELKESHDYHQKDGYTKFLNSFFKKEEFLEKLVDTKKEIKDRLDELKRMILEENSPSELSFDYEVHASITARPGSHTSSIESIDNTDCNIDYNNVYDKIKGALKEGCDVYNNSFIEIALECRAKKKFKVFTDVPDERKKFEREKHIKVESGNCKLHHVLIKKDKDGHPIKWTRDNRENTVNCIDELIDCIVRETAETFISHSISIMDTTNLTSSSDLLITKIISPNHDTFDQIIAKHYVEYHRNSGKSHKSCERRCDSILKKPFKDLYDEPFSNKREDPVYDNHQFSLNQETVKDCNEKVTNTIKRPRISDGSTKKPPEKKDRPYKQQDSSREGCSRSVRPTSQNGSNQLEQESSSDLPDPYPQNKEGPTPLEPDYNKETRIIDNWIYFSYVKNLGEETFTQILIKSDNREPCVSANLGDIQKKIDNASGPSKSSDGSTTKISEKQGELYKHYSEVAIISLELARFTNDKAKQAEDYLGAAVDYLNLADITDNLTKKDEYYRKAIECYEKASELYNESASIIVNINGVNNTGFDMRDPIISYKFAITSLKLVDLTNDRNKKAEYYRKLIECYKRIHLSFSNEENISVLDYIDSTYGKLADLTNDKAEKAISYTKAANSYLKLADLTNDNTGKAECYSKAIKFYLEALRYSEDTSILNDVDSTYEKLVNLTEEAKELNPGNNDILRLLGSIKNNLGVAKSNLGINANNSEKRIKFYEEAIVFFEEAIKLYEEAKELNPGDNDILRLLGSIKNNLGITYISKTRLKDKERQKEGYHALFHKKYNIFSFRNDVHGDKAISNRPGVCQKEEKPTHFINANERDYGCNDLHLAIAGNKIDDVKELIGTNEEYVKGKDLYRNTPLHFAVQIDSLEIFKVLMNYIKEQDQKKDYVKGYVMVKNYDGYTPLHYAARKGNTKIVKNLLDCLDETQRKKYVKEMTNEDEMSIHCAARSGNTEILAELLKHVNDKEVYVKKGNINECTPLHFAAENGKVRFIEILLNYIIDAERKKEYVKSPNNAGDTALHFAAKKSGNLGVINELLGLVGQEGQEEYVKCVNKLLYTPLHIAARKGNNEGVVNRLLECVVTEGEKEKYVTSVTGQGETALHFAARSGDVKVVEKLIDCIIGEDEEEKRKKKEEYVRAETNGKETSLHFAARNGNVKVVEKLLEYVNDKEAYVKNENSNKETSLHFAVNKGNNERVVNRLLECVVTEGEKEKYVTSVTGQGETALHFAARSGDVKVVEKLIDCIIGEDEEEKRKKKEEYVRAETNGKETSLHFAARGSNVEVVNKLLEFVGAETKEGCVQSKNGKGETPIELALKSGNSRVAQCLEINRCLDHNGGTILHVLSRIGCMKVIRDLLYEGADINAVDKNGFTPLHYAIDTNGSEKEIEELLYLGADPQVRYPDGRTPYIVLSEYWSKKDEQPYKLESVLQDLRKNKVIPEKLSRSSDFGELIEFANCYDQDGSLPIHLAARKGNVEDLKSLIKMGADVNSSSQKYGYTALHCVYSPQAAEVLIEAGADLNAELKESKWTPLHNTARNGAAEVVDILIKANANLGAKTILDYTPLHFAVFSGNEETVKILIEAGPDPNAVTKCGETPFSLAFKGRDFDVAGLLIKLDGYKMTTLVNALDIRTSSPRTTLNSVALDNQLRKRSLSF